MSEVSDGAASPSLPSLDLDPPGALQIRSKSSNTVLDYGSKYLKTIISASEPSKSGSAYRVCSFNLTPSFHG